MVGAHHAVADRVLRTGGRRPPGVEPLLGPLLVHGREAEAAIVGREVDPGQAAVELFPQELDRRGGAGGWSARRASTRSSTFADMSEPYSVHPCGTFPSRRTRTTDRTAWHVTDGRDSQRPGLAYEEYGDPLGFLVLASTAGSARISTPRRRRAGRR